MQTGISFKADENATLSSFTLLEEGNYKVRISKCKYEATPDGLGTNFLFSYVVTEGPYKGVEVTDKAIWSWNAPDKEKSVQMGHRVLNSILLAIGHPHFGGDTDEFLGGEMIVHATVRTYQKKDGSGEGKSNNFNEYKKVEGQNTVMNSAPVAPSMPQKPTFAGGAAPNNPFLNGRK